MKIWFQNWGSCPEMLPALSWNDEICMWKFTVSLYFEFCVMYLLIDLSIMIFTIWCHVYFRLNKRLLMRRENKEKRMRRRQESRSGIFHFIWEHSSLSCQNSISIGILKFICLIYSYILLLLRHFTWNAFMVLLEFLIKFVSSITISQKLLADLFITWQEDSFGQRPRFFFSDFGSAPNLVIF